MALSALGLLVVTGILSTDETLKVFSNSAPIVIGCMFVLSGALERTGAIDALARLFLPLAGASELRALLVLAVSTVPLSAFVNNTPVVVVFYASGARPRAPYGSKGFAASDTALVFCDLGWDLHSHRHLDQPVGGRYHAATRHDAIRYHILEILAQIFTPVAFEVAATLGLDARPFAVAVMFGCSASFATPIGYQTNTYVFGAGGYRFMDFPKVGAPLNLILWIAASALIPIFWPFVAKP